MGTQSLTLFDLVPGRVLVDRYELIRPNRQGGVSSAFEALDQKSDKTCELQILPGAIFDGQDQAKAFAEEMQRWTAVDSPHVLSVNDVVQLDNGTVMIVTDLPPDESVRERFDATGRWDIATTKHAGMQILEGACAIHAAGLVHGDIKPFTLHISGEGEDMHVVIVDGGLTPGLWSAKHLGDKTTLIGTPFYAPVEQFGGDAPTVQSDVYNIATVLFELVTGVIPWAGHTLLEVFQSKLDRAVPSMTTRAPEADVPAEFESAIVGGLMADRHARYGGAEEFLKRLQAVETD